MTASTTLVLVATVTCGLINDHKFSRRVSGAAGVDRWDEGRGER